MLKMSFMQARQTPTEVRQIPTICTLFLILFVGGTS